MFKIAVRVLPVAILVAATSFSAMAQSVTSHIVLPNFTTGGVAVNAVTNKIYAVSNSGSSDVNDTVSVIDGKSDSIVTEISVPSGAYLPAVNILTNEIYVASCNSLLNPAPCFVTVINGKTNSVVTTIPVTTVLNGFLTGIAVDPLTCTIYVSDNTNGDIAVINASTNTVTSTISLPGESPWGIALSPLTNQLYVTLGGSSIDIINLATKQITSASTGEDTSGFNVAVDALSGHVFVTNTQPGNSTVAVLDHNGKSLAQVPVGQAAFGIDADPLAQLVVTANANDNTSSVFSSKTNTPKATIAGTDALFLAINPVSRKFYAIGNGMVTVATE